MGFKLDVDVDVDVDEVPLIYGAADGVTMSSFKSVKRSLLPTG